MITTTICKSYKKEVLEGVHSLSDTYKIALYTNSATLNESTTIYITANEVTGINYTAGGLELTGFTTGLSGSIAYLYFDNAVWSESTITARGCLIYNSSKGNKAVAAFDFGADGISVSGDFTVTIPQGTSSPIRIA